jgi:diaminopimelate decarboxylase
MLYEQNNSATSQTGRRFYSLQDHCCETDTLPTTEGFPEIKEGDILSFRNTGAYCILWHLIIQDTDRPETLDEWKGHLIRAIEPLGTY